MNWEREAMMKRYWIFLFYAVSVALVVACGGGGGASTPPAVPTPEATIAPTAAPTQEATPTQEAPQSAETLGTLEIRVTDQPTDAVSSIKVTIKDIEVHVSGGDEMSGWRTVVDGTRQFDLMELMGIEEVLGDAILDSGKYQQVRFEVVEAVITVRGMPRQSPVPSGKIRLVGGFEVSPDAKTIITLDFDAEKSVVFRPGLGPQLKPVIKMLVRNEDETLAQARPVASFGIDTAPSPTKIPAPSSASTVRVAIPVADNLQWMNFYVAQGAGFFEDEGIDVQLVVPPMPSATGRFLAMGRAEVAVMPRPLFLQSIAAGDPVLAFANLLSGDPVNLIVQQQVADDFGLSMDMPLEDRLNAIRGLKVGVAVGPLARLRVLFESVGLDAESDIKIVSLQGEEQNPAFGEGTIDALYAHTPYLERALLNQGAVMIVNQSAGEVPELTNRQIHILVTTQGYADSNPEFLVAMARAVFRAQQLIHSDLDATVEAIRSSEVTLQEPDGLETIIAIYEPAIPVSPEVSVEGALRELELFYPAHLTPPDISAEEMATHVDNQFAEQAMAPSP